MDTSPEYIKMCEKAVEIQTLWQDDGYLAYDCDSVYIPPKPLDAEEWILNCWDAWMPCYTGCEYHYEELSPTSLSIWLPRQCQLQDMMPQKGVVAQFIRLHQLCWDMDEHDEFLLNVSWEQLWLCVLMHERYKKVWNGEDWISEQ